ncbi:hypothetical protein [Catellatospora tritici]|uniref:hypothetical protein n=1 Tax=Catellatospora tritici TaxID=2851566 RepID=UPI001C2DE181|nr:hypothetical protein [Catellatospora tritici]MBV1853610.1 hypothetical protein [Catellatospora tritici]
MRPLPSAILCAGLVAATVAAIATPAAAMPAGDLTIHRAGTCEWYQDSAANLWIAPVLAANWTGTTFPSNAFNMRSNYGKRTAGGPVTSAAPFRWAIGGEPTAGNSFLGHTVLLTATIDPINTVYELDESNNTTVITVPVPATPPPASGTVVTIPCF